MSLTIPDEVLQSANMTAEEALCEFAIYLFQSDRLTLAQAARMAGMARLPFQRVLASRKIPLHYTIEDFEDDLNTLKELETL